MNDELKNRLRTLCENAGTEHNPERLMELVHEIDRLLAADQDAGKPKKEQQSDLDKAV